MANNLKLSNEAVNAEADALSVLLDNGYLRIYDGTQAALTQPIQYMTQQPIT